MKRCTKCGVIKSESQFSIDNKTLDKLSHWCKKCVKEHADKRKQLKRNWYLEHEYAMLPGQYEMMEKSQNKVCRICHKTCSTGKRLAVDHCKETNKNRGLLCANCNTGIGQFKHNIELLKAAIKYLEETV